MNRLVTLALAAMLVGLAAPLAAQRDDDPTIRRAKEALRELGGDEKLRRDEGFLRAAQQWPQYRRQIEEAQKHQNEALQGSLEAINEARTLYASRAESRGTVLDLYLHGRLLGLTGELESAYDYFKRALGLDMYFYWAWDGLGVYHLNRGNYALSREAFDRVLQLQPGDRKAAFGIVETHTQEGNIQAAVARLNEIITRELESGDGRTLNPEVEKQARLQLADLYRRQGQPAQAIEELNWLASKEPRNFAVFALRAHCATNLERWADAIRDYRQMLEIDPFDFRVHFYIARCLVAQGRNGDAIVEYQAGLAAGGQRVDRDTRDMVESELDRLGKLPPVQAPEKRRLDFEDLLAMAKNAPDVQKRRGAILNLARMPMVIENQEAVRSLFRTFLEGIKDPDPVIVAKCVEQIVHRWGHSARSEEIRELVSIVAMEKRDPRVRGMAFELLGSWEARKVIPTLLVGLRAEEDPETFARIHETMNTSSLAFIERVLPYEIDAADMQRIRGAWNDWYRRNRDVYRRFEPKDFTP